MRTHRNLNKREAAALRKMAERLGEFADRCGIRCISITSNTREDPRDGRAVHIDAHADWHPDDVEPKKMYGYDLWTDWDHEGVRYIHATPTKKASR